MYLALFGSVPSVIVLVFFTDEFGQFLNGLTALIQISKTWALVAFASTVPFIFLLVFLMHLHFLKRKSYSFIATTHILIQLLIVATCLFLVATFRPATIYTNNWLGYLLIGFLLSVVCSEASYLHNYTKACPLHLIPIENLLSKNPKTMEDSTPSFLRLGGFLWVDFQNHITVKRVETEEVMKRLKKENSLLLIGDQASGKSIILRDVGYQLAHAGFIVFFVNADSLDVDLALADIKNWDMSNVVMLIDDVHRNISKVSDFVNKMWSSNIKVVLSSRPTNFDVLRERQGNRLLDIFEKHIEVKVTEETIYDMIMKYVESIGAISALSNFKPNASQIGEIIQRCGTDLWLITYLLSAWNPKKTTIAEIAKADIFQKVYESRISLWGISDKNSLHAMQTVCALYQFEIPCSETYLIEMNFNRTARRLASEGHLIKKGAYYYLHHPSVAKIYLDTLQYYHLLDDSTAFSISVLLSYLRRSKEDRPQVFYKLSIAPKSLEKGALILKGMLKQIKIEDIVGQVNQEENLDKIGLFFCSLRAIDPDCAREILLRVGPENLIKKLLRQPVLKRQRNLIDDISQVDVSVAMSLSERRPRIASVLPLFNEESLVTLILRDLFDFVDIAVVIDDGSTDATGKKASEMGARVIRHTKSEGLISALLTGLNESLDQDSDIIVLDIFPWINRSYIPNLMLPIMKQSADLVTGVRGKRDEVIGVQEKELDYIQALNRKAAEKFLRYLPSEHFANTSNLGETYVLFSRMLKVEKVDIKVLATPLNIVEHTVRQGIHGLPYRMHSYYYGRYSDWNIMRRGIPG